MNKKGFTLIEMLIVVALIAVVFGVAVPRITKTMGSSYKRNFETKKSLIVNTAEMYAQDKHNTLTPSGGPYNISVSDLLQNGYLEPDLARGEDCSYDEGCLVDDTGNILNNKTVKVEVKNKRYIGTWDNN